MRWIVLLHLALAAPDPARLSDEERASCGAEIEVLERRRKVFEGQGLSGAEVARRNASHLRTLEECLERLRAGRLRATEEARDAEEAARRAGPDATEKEREAAWREVRRERLAGKAPSSLTQDERAELAAGVTEELATTHAALDGANARDPAFLRIVHSALACHHGDRQDELLAQLASEEALVTLGTGDRQRVYALRSDLRRTQQILERSREAARGFPGGLERCGETTVRVLSHCLAAQDGGTPSEAACASEEVQRYLRFAR